MPVHNISKQLDALFLNPNIPGYERFFTTYLFHGEKKAIIDTGPSSAIPSLFAELRTLGIQPREIDYIILSHIHMDHSGGTGAAMQEMTRAAIVAHERAVAHLINPGKLWEASVKTLGDLAYKYGEIKPIPEDRITGVSNSTTLDLGQDLILEIFPTPGHAVHHLSIFHRSSGTLIAGEAAGVCIDGALRPSTPPPFKLEETLSSIDKLIALKPCKVCFAHLGCYPSDIDLLKRSKEKLIKWYEVTNLLSMQGKTPEEIFNVLKEKDSELNYLANLTPDEQAREYKMLINNIIGMINKK